MGLYYRRNKIPLLGLFPTLGYFLLFCDWRIKLFDKKEYSESLLDLFSALACTWLWRAFTRSCYWKKRKLSSISNNLAFLWLSNFVVEELLATQKISKFIPARTYSSKSFTFFWRKQNLSPISNERRYINPCRYEKRLKF